MKKLIKLLVLLLVLTSCTPSDKSDIEDKVNIDTSEIKVQEEKEAESKRIAEEKAKQEAEAKKQAEDKARQEAEAKRKAEDKKLAEEKAKKQAEQKREAEEKARQEAEAKKLAEEKAKKEAEAKRIADQKRIAEEKAKREAKAKRLAEEKRIADEKAKKEAEAKKLAEQKLLAEERAKQEAEAKRLAEEKAAKAKLQPNRIYYDGSNVKFFDIGIDNYNPDRTQKYIDDGNIISTVTKFNPTDNEITYFSGHSYNYNNVARLKVSSIVTITDKNGVGYKYKIVDMKKYPAGEVDQEAPFIGGYHLMDLAGEGIKKESIVIQYCDEYDVPMIFFGVPV